MEEGKSEMELMANFNVQMTKDSKKDFGHQSFTNGFFSLSQREASRLGNQPCLSETDLGPVVKYDVVVISSFNSMSLVKFSHSFRYTNQATNIIRRKSRTGKVYFAVHEQSSPWIVFLLPLATGNDGAVFSRSPSNYSDHVSFCMLEY